MKYILIILKYKFSYHDKKYNMYQSREVKEKMYNSLRGIIKLKKIQSDSSDHIQNDQGTENKMV
jgi:hypothetical protein